MLTTFMIETLGAYTGDLRVLSAHYYARLLSMCMCAHVFVCMYVCACGWLTVVFVYVCGVCVCFCAYVCMCARVFVCTCVHAGG